MNRFKKVVLTGVLALSPIIGVSAASAAPLNTISDSTLSSLTKQYGIDLNSLLQGQQGQWHSIPTGSNNVYAGGYWTQIPVGNGNGSNNDWNCNFGIPSVNPGNGAGQGNVDDGGTADNGSEDNGGTVDNGNVDNGGDTGNVDNGSANGGNTGSGSTGNTGSGTVNEGTSEQSAFATEVINLVNQERAKAGLGALTEDKALSNMALDKAKDMYNNNYFDHNSPTYGSPFDMMKTYGISYSYAGENIAKGQRSPQEVMNSWMNSPGHRQNIMSPNYTKIGVAYYNGEWVQEFIAN
ncbi:CAP domain-containing protein [Paenibacillus sp. NPDC056579]|uniref:CAP domain-containing protein n=1 Tax=Paenibacillus sp. NPDC056579 TaxID=3345871 RepID=UPI0036D08115